MTFKVGDKVVSGFYGEGVVESVTAFGSPTYPLIVKFINDDVYKGYTLDGNASCSPSYLGSTKDIKLKEKKVSYFPCKIKVNSPLESKAVQEWLFEQGVIWEISGKQVMYVYEPYLYCDTHFITHGVNGDSFAHDKRQELKFSFVTNVVVESVILPPAPVELVELNGKKYKKEDLETALKHIKPVGE